MSRQQLTAHLHQQIASATKARIAAAGARDDFGKEYYRRKENLLREQLRRLAK